MRLVTADGKFVAEVEPLLPLEPGHIVFWGERIFLRHCFGKRDGDYCQTWVETMPTVVREC